jgi:hypothetical protein
MNFPDTNITKGYDVAAGDGERIWIVGDTMTFKATAASTGGSLMLVENLTAPGGGPPRRHELTSKEAGSPPSRAFARWQLLAARPPASSEARS